MTRGEAVTWLRNYKKEIPKYNFHYGNPMRDPEFLWSSYALYTADELIRRIQEKECDPLEVVRHWCIVMDEAMNEFENQGVGLRFAHMSEAIGRDILRCMRAKDKNLLCKTQIANIEKRHRK